MADPHALQRGDVSPDFSDYNFSNEADRRQPETYHSPSNPMNYHGQYPAADQAQAEAGRRFKVGQATPTMQAPWSVIEMDGDNNGQPAEVHEIEILKYGDCYDPTSPMRVREVGSEWKMDTDNDGQRN